MNTALRLLLSSALAVAISSQAAIAPPGKAPEGSGSVALHARYSELASKLEHNAFGRPLHIVSREGDSDVKGEVYAVLAHPFDTVEHSLDKPANWCKVMLLPFNTKGCIASASGDGIELLVGRKKDTPADQAFRLGFHYAVKSLDDDYLQVALDAENGPLGTRNYRIGLEAAPLDNGRTFLHLTYSYTFGAMSRMAMQTYLATAGADKVGFSTDGNDDQGKPRFVGGMRGVIERNTMRYFLAIEAFLGSLATQSQQARIDKQLRDWFTATERYPRQLHEMDLGEYLAMKRGEYRRQTALWGISRAPRTASSWP